MSQQEAKTLPVDRIRVGRVSAAIWQQATDEGRRFYTFSVDRRYKDDAGEYQSALSFGLSDALVLAKVANVADSRIRKLLDADYELLYHDVFVVGFGRHGLRPERPITDNPRSALLQGGHHEHILPNLG